MNHECPEEISTPRPAEWQAIFILFIVLSLHHMSCLLESNQFPHLLIYFRPPSTPKYLMHPIYYFYLIFSSSQIPIRTYPMIVLVNYLSMHIIVVQWPACWVFPTHPVTILPALPSVVISYTFDLICTLVHNVFDISCNCLVDKDIIVPSMAWKTWVTPLDSFFGLNKMTKAF
jgi:hypothetical protein